MSDTVVILSRMYRMQPFIQRAVTEIQNVREKIIWRVLWMEGNIPEKALLENMRFSNNESKLEIIDSRMQTACDAIIELFKRTSEDIIYIYDPDNLFLSDRITKHAETCSNKDGVCAVQTLFIGTDKSTIMPGNGFKIEDLLQKRFNQIDTGALRIDGNYMRNRILPTMNRFYGRSYCEDYFILLLALHDGKLCYHNVPLHTHCFNPNHRDMYIHDNSDAMVTYKEAIQ